MTVWQLQEMIRALGPDFRSGSSRRMDGRSLQVMRWAIRSWVHQARIHGHFNASVQRWVVTGVVGGQYGDIRDSVITLGGFIAGYFLPGRSHRRGFKDFHRHQLNQTAFQKT